MNEISVALVKSYPIEKRFFIGRGIEKNPFVLREAPNGFVNEEWAEFLWTTHDVMGDTVWSTDGSRRLALLAPSFCGSLLRQKYLFPGYS